MRRVASGRVLAGPAADVNTRRPRRHSKKCKADKDESVDAAGPFKMLKSVINSFVPSSQLV